MSAAFRLFAIHYFPTSRLCFDCRFSIELGPTNGYASGGNSHRFDHYVAHHLAIAEPLQEKPPKQTPALFLLEKKSETRGQPVNHQEQHIIKKNLTQVCGGV